MPTACNVLRCPKCFCWAYCVGMTTRECAHCLGPILRSGQKGRPPKYCSVQCNTAAQNAKDKASRAAARSGRCCDRCGAQYDASSASQRFCCLDCNIRWHNEAKSEAKRQARADSGRSCSRCRGPIPPERTAAAKYCSRRCARADLTSRPRHKALQRDLNLKRLYGVSAIDVQAMVERQGGGCAVCGTTDWPGKGRCPHVDHDHQTGLIRGALCDPCNRGLGMFADNPARLRAAAHYLDLYASRAEVVRNGR